MVAVYCSSNGLWWHSISALMPVVVAAAKEFPPGVHSVQIHREQANIPYQNVAK